MSDWFSKARAKGLTKKQDREKAKASKEKELQSTQAFFRQEVIKVNNWIKDVLKDLTSDPDFTFVEETRNRVVLVHLIYRKIDFATITIKLTEPTEQNLHYRIDPTISCSYIVNRRNPLREELEESGYDVSFNHQERLVALVSQYVELVYEGFERFSAEYNRQYEPDLSE